MKQPFHHSMMTHFRKRLTDVLAELNEVVATAGAKETKDHDDNNVSGGGGKVKRSKKRASVIEAEQQTLFAEPQVEPSAATSPVEQTAGPEPLEATAPPSEGHPVSAMESEAPALPNQGTVLMDATCAPADVAYPTDLNLLNEAREKLESIIDTLHVPAVSKATKPRTYREKARKQFGGVQATQAGTQSDPQSNQAAARLRWTEPLHHRRASQGATAHAA